MKRIHSLPTHALALGLSLLSGPRAQGPEGRIVVASEGASELGAGGLFLANPTGGNQRPVVVSGLPAELLGTPLDTTPNGASAVLVRPSDQTVVVGNSAEPGGEVALLAITLNGAAAAVDERILLGHNTAGGARSRGVEEVAELPSGELLVVLDQGVTADPGGTLPLVAVRIDLSTNGNPTVSAFPIQPAIGTADLVGVAVAADRVHFAKVTDPDLPSAVTEVFSTPLAGGPRTTLASFPGQTATGLDLDVDGFVVVSFATELFRIEPTTGTSTRIRANLRDCEAVASLAFNDRIMLLRRHTSGARNHRISTQRSRAARVGFTTLTGATPGLGHARDLSFAAAPPPPPPPPPPVRLRGNPGGNALVAAEGSTADGNGGLFLLNPTRFEDGALPIRGLPDALRGRPLDGIPDGANSVFTRASDQLVFVGGGSSVPGSEAKLFTLRLDGDLATVLNEARIGTHTGTSLSQSARIQQIAELPDGNLILACDEILTRRQGTRDIPARATLVAPDGTLIGNFRIGPAEPIGDYTGVAVDAARGVVYFAIVNRTGFGPTTTLIEVPVTGGAFRLFKRLDDLAATGLAIDNRGLLIVATLSDVFEIDPVSGAERAIRTDVSDIQGITNAASADQLVLQFAQNGDQVATMAQGQVNPPLGFLTREGESMGRPRDVQILPSPHVVAAGTPGARAYGWAVRPNPGGMAFPGNLDFSLTLEADAPGPLPAGVLLLGLARNPVVIQGLALEVDTTTASLLPFAGAPTQRSTLPIPIPTDPLLIDLKAFAQAILVEAGGGLATSDAVTFRVL